MPETAPRHLEKGILSQSGLQAVLSSSDLDGTSTQSPPQGSWLSTKLQTLPTHPVPPPHSRSCRSFCLLLTLPGSKLGLLSLWGSCLRAVLRAAGFWTVQR